MIEQEKPSCAKCARRTENHYCSLQGRKVRDNMKCDGFKMKLADHYVPNPWDKWKAARQAEQAVGKKK